jgi:acyl-coenzyme A thioesterase PaaI-like protein
MARKGEAQETQNEHTAGERVADEEGGRQERAFFEYWNQLDMLSWMGARITDSADGHATVYFEPGKHHRGAGVGGRAVTGAVQAYIFDIVTGAAVASLAHGTKPQVTVKLDVTFERPAYNDPLTFEARVLSGGSHIFFVDGVCRDVNGVVCSRAVAIYRRFDKRIAAPVAEASTPHQRRE